VVTAATSQIRGSSVLFVGRILALGISLVTQVVLVRALSKAGFGAFAYALSIVTFLRTVVSFGEDQALTRFLSIYDEEDDPRKLFGTLVMAAVKILVTSSVVLVALFVVRDGLLRDTIDDPLTVSVLLVLVFLAPVDAFDRLLEGCFAVFSRPRAIFFRKYVVEPGLRLVAVLSVVLLDRDATFLATAYVAGALVGLGVYAATLVGALRERGLLGRVRFRDLSYPVRAYFGFSFPLLTTELVNVSLNTFTVFVLGRSGGTTDVASFRAILPAARLNQLVIFTFTVLFTPMASRLYARGDTAGIREAYWQTAMWLVVFSFPVFAVTGPLAGPTTTTLFGERYASSGPYLAVLAVGYYLNASMGFNALTLQVFGRLRWIIGVNVVATVVAVVSSLVLIPRHGALGAAIAIGTTVVLQNLGNQLGLARLGVGAWDASVLPVQATAVALALVLWAVQALLAPPFVVGLLVAAVCAAVLLVTSRRRLRVHETFPELASVPILGRLLAS
jgi:O-antigen/teichoic acid export membrane protein